MATVAHSESKRMYSWWWNTHISPKNSKWLQENLADIDGKIKAMVRIIEEDADSFAKRAEMYYKKRPELRKLVEEFYRAYRSLAERYDHATGVLRQAHRTMAVVFPNQIPLDISDEIPSGFAATEAEPNNSEMLTELFNNDGPKIDVSSMPTLFEAMKMSGAFAEEIDLKSLHEMFTNRGNRGKDLGSQEDKGSEMLPLRDQITLQSNHADKAEAEVQQLKENLSKERTEKEDVLYHYNESLARISNLEAEISCNQEDLRRLNNKLLVEAENLISSKEQIVVLQKAKQSLEFEVEKLNKLKGEQQKELNEKGEELAELEISLKDECVSYAKQYGESQDELKIALEKLKNMEASKLSLEEALQRGREENNRLNEQKLSSTLKIINLQNEIISLRELKEKLQDDVKYSREEKELIYQELCQLNEERNNLEQAHQVLNKQFQEASLEMETLRATVKELKDGSCNLKETIKIYESEKVLYLHNLEQMEQCCEKLKHVEVTTLSLERELLEVQEENNSLNEQTLSSSMKIINFQEEIMFLKDLKRKFEDQLEQCRKENEVLHLELCQLKVDRISFEERHLVQKEQIEAVSLEMESLQTMINVLGDENKDLEETINRHEHEKALCLHNLEHSKKQYAESQEEVRGVNEKLKEMQTNRLNLEEIMQKISEENSRLHEENLSSILRIVSLQDEIIFLKSLKRKLEDEMELGRGENEFLYLEVCQLKEERKNSELRQNMLQEHIQAITLEMKSFQAMIKELKDGNNDLKEAIKRHENEKVCYLQNFKQIQTTSERNALLEISLSDANNELESLRGKIQALENSCDNFRSRISLDEAEKNVLISHMDAAAQNIEKLLSKNTFLENSLSDINVELDSLKGKLKILDESCRSLDDQKSVLISEKDTLIAKVESTSCSLRNLENSYAELRDKCSNLEREKASILNAVAEQQQFLRVEKENHNSLIQSSKNKLNKLENKIYHLEKECRKREEELEVEQYRIMNAQNEIFILQRCLCDIKEENLSNLLGLQKHQETIRCAEKNIIQLKQECLVNETKIVSSAKQSERIRGSILQIIKMLEIDLRYVSLDNAKDEFLVQLILCEVRHLFNFISEAHDEKQILILEKSIVITLLEQFGLYVEELRAGVIALDGNLKLREEELTFLKGKNDKTLEINEQLKEKMQVGSQREDLLKAEVDVLFRQLSQLQETHCKLQIESSRMHEENQLLSKKLHGLRINGNKLEEDNNVMLIEFMAVDYLSVALMSYLAERELEQQKLSVERDYLCKTQNDLVRSISIINRKVEVVEAENKQLKQLSTDVAECRRFLSTLDNDLSIARSVINVCEQLNLQSHTGRTLVLETYDSSLVKNKQRSQITNAQSRKTLEDRKMVICEAKVMREDVEKNISTPSEDCGCTRNEPVLLHQANGTMKLEFERNKKDEKFRIKEQNYDMQSSTNEINSLDVEMLSLLHEIQRATINATLLREKVTELIPTCESIQRSAMLQMEVLNNQIKIRDGSLKELKENLNGLEEDNRRLKEELNAYMSILGTFWDDIAILEQQTLSLGRNHPFPNNQGKQVHQAGYVNKRNQGLSEISGAVSPAGILELQNLQAKIRALQKQVRDTRSILELERLDSNASLEAAWKEIEALRSKDNSDNDSSKKKYEKMTRDIKLDIVLNSWQPTNRNSHGARKRGNANEISDQNIELWRTTEDENSNQKKNSPLVIEEDGAAPHQIDEENMNHPSGELVSEKELGVDKLEIPQKTDTLQEWNRRVMEKLDSDAQRLSALQANIQQLNKIMEALEKINPTINDFDTAKVQLKEAEITISKLIDINKKLTKKTRELSEAASQVGEKKDIGNRSRRQISDRTEKVSEKIGKLEKELHNIQYTFQKIEEEHSSKKTRVAEKSGVLLKEYIYGKKDGQKKKRGTCGCMRPKAKGD